MTSLAFFPVVETEDQLMDILSRAAWFLSFCPLDRIYVPVASENLQDAGWRLAPGMDGSIAGKLDRLRGRVSLVLARGVNDLEACMKESQYILHWKESARPDFVSEETLAGWHQGRKVLQVDPVATRQEGGAYIDVGLHLLKNRSDVIRQNREKFNALLGKLGRFDRAYLLATGPSVAEYGKFDYAGTLNVVCNSVILDEELMDKVHPQILVFADPIFHFGPSQYAAAFRAKLLESAGKHDYTICIPFKYYPLFTSAMPELASRTIGIPFDKDRPFNFDLGREFVLKTTKNILTMVMVPIAATFAREICFLGCDGRPLEENTYFWNHNPGTQFNDKMGNIRQVHPGFFNIDYNDYYLEHCELLEQQFRDGERIGKKFVSLGFSHIPALGSRSLLDGAVAAPPEEEKVQAREMATPAISPVPELPVLENPAPAKRAAVDPERFPRLLMIDSTPLGGLSATGQIKQVLLGDWPADRFLQIWEMSGPAPVLGTIRIGESEADSRARWQGEDILLDVCREFKPDVIYVRPVESMLLMDFAEKALDALGKPFVVHMMDDWPERLSRQNPARHKVFDQALKRLAAGASRCLGISERMSEAYLERYGREFAPLANGVDVESFPARNWPQRPPVSPDRPFVIRYMGGLATDMTFLSVLDVARAVAASWNSVPVSLEIYTMSWYLDAARKVFREFPGVQVFPLVESRDYQRHLAGADALLIAYNFDEDSIRYVGLSMANKLPECLAAGVPIIAYGPEAMATIARLKESGCARLVTERSVPALRSEIEALATSLDRCRELGTAGRRHAAEHYDRSLVQEAFLRIHREAASDTTSRLETASTVIQPGDISEAAGAPDLAVPSPQASTLATSQDPVTDRARPANVAPPRIRKRSRTLVVLGNGPSLRGFSFRRLRDFDAVGMNAAYRYWDRIGWYPRYYLCLDLVVGMHHRNAIARLIRERARNGMECFLLRRNLIDALPRELAALDCVLDFDALHGASALFPSAPITTGSRATLLGALLRYDRMILLGIDCDYVQVVEGAEPRGGTVLELVRTPAFNPNYFFDQYQVAGDRFNVPESSPDLHLESWRQVAPVLAARGIRVWNGSVSSRLDAFPKRDFADIEREEAAFRSGRLVVRMDAPPAGRNWHAPETRKGWGRFCWTGPDARATLDLAIGRHRENLAVVACHAPLLEDQLAGLRVEVDGAPVPHAVRDDLDPRCIVARVPARPAAPNGKTELALVVPHTVSLASLPGGSDDARLVGLPVSSVSVIPAEPRLPARSPLWLAAWRRLSGRRADAEELPLSYFDGLAYLKANLDVAEAVFSGRIPSAFEHYRLHGRKERRRFALATGREPISGTLAEAFDGLAYLEAHPDVAETVRSGRLRSALDHFLAHGREEGRRPVLLREGEACRGTAAELIRLDAARDARSEVNALNLQLHHLVETRLLAVRQESAASEAIRDEREKALQAQVDEAKSELARARDELSRAARSDDLGRLQQQAKEELTDLREALDASKSVRDAGERALLARIDLLKADLARAQQEMAGAARTGDVTRLRQQAEAELTRLRGELSAQAGARDAREKELQAQIETLKPELAKAQDLLSLAARADDIRQLKSQAEEQLKTLRDELAQARSDISSVAESDDAERRRLDALQNRVHGEVVGALAREKRLLGQVEALKSDLARMEGALSGAAGADALERMQQEGLRNVERLQGELNAASALRDGREQALLAQLEALRADLARAREGVAGAARTADLDRLERDVAREFERARGDMAMRLSLREAREQALNEQLELLRIGLDESQRRLSASARTEDVERLKQDALHNLERIRNEIGATNSVWNAREQAMLAQIDALKAEINATRTRAELAEVKVDAAQRNLGTETREISGSVQRSLAELERLQKELADNNSRRESKESVIRSELELVKHELSVAQMGNVVTSRSRAGKPGNPIKSWSQLGQDVWVIERASFKKGGYFVDIGATDGVLLNNTYLLETQYGWKGICIEPAPAAFSKLKDNRKARCSNTCLWSTSGEDLDFILAKEYGAISRVAGRDKHADKRNAYEKLGETIKVRTTSLNDLLARTEAPALIDYISLDTEGSEYEILSTFDFSRWKVAMWTIEHNHAEQRESIFKLMSARGYKRREVKFDDWYYL